MTDEQIIRSGQTVANESLEVMSDVIQAFISALSEMSSAKDREVLDAFADYVREGGELSTTICDRESFDLFEEIAKTNGLTYYAALDQTSGKVSIIVKDTDIEKLVDISREMTERGQMIMKNPQLPVAAYTQHFGGDVMYVNIDSYEQIEKSKSKAAELDAHFAVARKNDGSYMVLTSQADLPKLEEAGVIPMQSTAMILAHQSNLQDVLKIVKERRRQEEKKRMQEKAERKNHSREMTS